MSTKTAHNSLVLKLHSLNTIDTMSALSCVAFGAPEVATSASASCISSSAALSSDDIMSSW